MIEETKTKNNLPDVSESSVYNKDKVNLLAITPTKAK
jgi:hypothetical protein